MAYYNDLKKYGTKTAIIDKNENEITYEELDEFFIKKCQPTNSISIS